MNTIREEYLNNLVDDFKAMSDILSVQFNLVKQQLKHDIDEQEWQSITANEQAIDLYEVRFREVIVSDIVRYTPRAGDLRKMISLLNIIIDMERVGDLLYGVGKRMRRINAEKDVFIPFKEDLFRLFEMVQKMFDNAVFSFLSENEYIAKNTIKSDDEVDAFYHEIHKRLFLNDEVSVNGKTLSVFLDVSRILYLLERIGDCSTNISEDVIYLVEGVNVKHTEK